MRVQPATASETLRRTGPRREALMEILRWFAVLFAALALFFGGLYWLTGSRR